MLFPVTKLPPKGKEYFCFQKYGKSAHSTQCSKSCVLTKLIYTIIYIDSFYHQCVVIKGLLHSEQLNQHMIIIGVDQSLSNSAFYEHKCLGNIK